MQFHKLSYLTCGQMFLFKAFICFSFHLSFVLSVFDDKYSFHKSPIIKLISKREKYSKSQQIFIAFNNESTAKKTKQSELFTFSPLLEPNFPEKHETSDKSLELSPNIGRVN